MSRVLVELLGLAPTAVYTAELDLPRVELRLEITDPRTNEARALPAGPRVSLVDGAGKVVDQAKVGDGGCAHLLGGDAATEVGLEIDFSDREWLDLDADAYVAAGGVRANDPRPLLRLPRRWSSRDQGSFSDDRSGAFAKGAIGALEDGALGTEEDPWVLRIDHAWRKLLLELRYTNTIAAGQAPLPPGPVVEAAYDAGGPGLRLAAGSTVLDGSGLVALWIFDSKAKLGEMSVRMRSASDSYIDMDAAGSEAIVTVAAAKHRAMLPKARARLHPLPEILRLHEQPAEQGGQRGPLAALLPGVRPAPARVRVPIDVLVELRLVLHDPAAGSPMPLPAGVEVVLTDRRDRPLIAGRTGDDGRVSLFAPPGSRDVGIEVDFSGAPYLDLVNAAFVTSEKAEPNVALSLVRLPDRWRSIDQSRLSDDRAGTVVSGRLPTLRAGDLGTPDAPWELDLGHAWQRTELVFQYYDVTARAVRPVVFGPLVEAFDDPRLRDRDLVAGSTVLDADGRVHLMFFRAIDPAQLRIRLRTAPNSVVATGATDPEQRVRVVRDAILRSMPVGERQRRYPLPRVWLSRGQITRFAVAPSAPGRLFEDAVADALSTDVEPPRIYFDLDDFVLVNPSGVPLRFARDLDLTVFHHDMSIRAPKTSTKQPYFSDIGGALNHFAGNHAYYTRGSGAEKTARVVRRGKRFYDLTDQRTLRGHIVGARAAVANAHPHEHIHGKHEPGKRPGLANCDLHYFEDVAADPVDTARSLSVLLVFFSVRIRPMVGVQPTTVSALQVALAEAADRWEAGKLSEVLNRTPKTLPDVRVRTDVDAHDVKIAFHFVAFDDREGHAALWLYNDLNRAFAPAVIGSMMLEKTDVIPSSPLPTYVGLEDGHSYVEHTVAHELGHAMGLGDEYYERFRTTREVPTLHQYPWDFLHLSFDKTSLMHDMFVPRLRHYWIFSRWLEREQRISRIAPGQYEISCDTALVVGHTAGRLHRFRLPEEHPWPYEPALEEQRYRPGGHGRGRLRLYFLGDDIDVYRFSTSGVLSGVDAVLYWDIKAYIRMNKNIHGLKMASKIGYVESIYDAMAEAIGAYPTRASSISPPLSPAGHPLPVTHCFAADLDLTAPASGLAARHAKRVLIYVLPRFTFSNPASADFWIHVRPASTTSGPENITDLHDARQHGRRLSITDKVPGQAILRYMMGSDVAHLRPGAEIQIDLAPVPAGPTFSVWTSNGFSKVLHSVHGSRTHGANDFDGSGAPSEIARDIAAAIRDPANAFAGHVTASANGKMVRVAASSPGIDVTLSSPPTGARVQSDWRGRFEEAELEPLATWIGRRLGGTYRITLHE